MSQKQIKMIIESEQLWMFICILKLIIEYIHVNIKNTFQVVHFKKLPWSSNSHIEFI